MVNTSWPFKHLSTHRIASVMRMSIPSLWDKMISKYGYVMLC